MGVEPQQSQLLESFREKISECINMVGTMAPEERITVSVNFLDTDLIIAKLTPVLFLTGSGNLECCF